MSVTSLIYGQNKEIADSLLKVYRENKPVDDSTLKELLYQLSIYSVKPDECVSFADELIKLSLKNDYFNLHRAYYQKGQALRTQGRLKEAIKSLFKGLEYGIKNNDLVAQGSIYLALADAYSVADDRHNSMNYYEKAIQIFRTNGDSLYLGGTLLNLGTEYLLVDKLSKSLENLFEAKSIFEAINYQKGIAYCLGNIGYVYKKEKNFEQAEHNFLSASSILIDIGDYYSYTSYQNGLAEIYFEQSDYRKSTEAAKNAYEYAIHNGLIGCARDASLNLSKIYRKLNNTDLAYNYLNKYFIYRDSLNNEETTRKIAQIRTDYEVSQKQAEIDLLVKEKRIRSVIGISLGIILLVSSGMLILLYRNWNQNKKLSAQLSAQKLELVSQRDVLEELNQTKNRFFSIISHDLRGPIGILNGTTLLIREYLNSKNYQELEELTANMEYSVKKVQFLLDNLLEWAISQQNQFQYHPELIELNDLAYEVISVFEGMALAKNIELSYTCKFEKFYIIADRNSLMTILRNLVNNSLKFTHKNGQVHISALKQNDNVIISVIDNGVGIPESKLKNLFKIDQEKSTWGTEREKGLGIGLSLVHEFVLLNKGTIDVESEVGRGTKFTVKIPAETVITEKTMKQQLA